MRDRNGHIQEEEMRSQARERKRGKEREREREREGGKEGGRKKREATYMGIQAIGDRGCRSKQAFLVDEGKQCDSHPRPALALHIDLHTTED